MNIDVEIRGIIAVDQRQTIWIVRYDYLYQEYVAIKEEDWG